ncbi:hypothetical protein KDN32_04265 [Nocardioides sp. J2M5]|uniref:hypothetical protein n=1 Tax=Nocardioides palaemonis TaxID=2829810 RepID=UPI001BA4F8ED|nr:hypothetical protein [Nocardioides palaemonis]MBS2936957.1 hypothetical protein [Nocardioides palaemonis]
MRKHHSALGGVALALALTLTGCGGDDPDPKVQETPTETPSQTPTSTPTPKTPEEKAAAQLTAYLDVRDDALRAMKVNGKRLDKVAAGQEYLTLQQRIIEYSSNKFTLSGAYVHNLGEPRQRSDVTMLVEDCEDETGVEFLTATGKPVKRSLGGVPIPAARSVKYTLTLTKGRWLVTASTYVLDENGQVQPC